MFRVTVGGWLLLAFGLVYGLKEPLSRLSVASKKLTTFLFASIVMLSSCSLNTCQIFFFII